VLPVRIYFEKSGPARYISHLDLLRCFERSLRRAEIPFWYTEGFNPRPFMSFAQPLSLGTIGLREIVDIRLVEDMSFDTVIQKLNAVLPEGLVVHNAVIPQKKVNDIAASRYRITFSTSGISDMFCRSLNDFLSQDSIIIQKLNKKKKPVDVDLKKFIHRFSTDTADDSVVLDITLSSGCTENCNPSLVINAFFEAFGCGEADHIIVREMILDTNGEEFA